MRLRNVISITLIELLLVLIGLIIGRKDVLSLKSNNLRIEQSATVIEKISKIARLCSACYYEELVVFSRKPNAHVDNALGNAIASLVSAEDGIVTDELCIIAKGRVRAGYNFDALTADALKISGDSLCLSLPKPMVLDVQLNPSDCEVYVSDGHWTQDEMAALQKEAKDKLYVNALSSGILETASKSAEKQIRALLQSLGYPTVVIE